MSSRNHNPPNYRRSQNKGFPRLYRPRRRPTRLAPGPRRDHPRYRGQAPPISRSYRAPPRAMKPRPSIQRLPVRPPGPGTQQLRPPPRGHPQSGRPGHGPPPRPISNIPRDQGMNRGPPPLLTPQTHRTRQGPPLIPRGSIRQIRPRPPKMQAPPDSPHSQFRRQSLSIDSSYDRNKHPPPPLEDFSTQSTGSADPSKDEILLAINQIESQISQQEKAIKSARQKRKELENHILDIRKARIKLEKLRGEKASEDSIPTVPPGPIYPGIPKLIDSILQENIEKAKKSRSEIASIQFPSVIGYSCFKLLEYYKSLTISSNVTTDTPSQQLPAEEEEDTSKLRQEQDDTNHDIKNHSTSDGDAHNSKEDSQEIINGHLNSNPFPNLPITPHIISAAKTFLELEKSVPNIDRSPIFTQPSELPSYTKILELYETHKDFVSANISTYLLRKSSYERHLSDLYRRQSAIHLAKVKANSLQRAELARENLIAEAQKKHYKLVATERRKRFRIHQQKLAELRIPYEKALKLYQKQLTKYEKFKTRYAIYQKQYQQYYDAEKAAKEAQKVSEAPDSNPSITDNQEDAVLSTPSVKVESETPSENSNTVNAGETQHSLDPLKPGTPSSIPLEAPIPQDPQDSQLPTLEPTSESPTSTNNEPPPQPIEEEEDDEVEVIKNESFHEKTHFILGRPPPNPPPIVDEPIIPTPPEFPEFVFNENDYAFMFEGPSIHQLEAQLSLKEQENEANLYDYYYPRRAPIPTMISKFDPPSLTYFDSKNNQILNRPGPQSRHADSKTPWTMNEIRIFLKKFMKNPCDFPKIAKYLPHKHTEDVVSFYYKFKFKLNLAWRLHNYNLRNTSYWQRSNQSFHGDDDFDPKHHAPKKTSFATVGAIYGTETSIPSFRDYHSSSSDSDSDDEDYVAGPEDDDSPFDMSEQEEDL